MKKFFSILCVLLFSTIIVNAGQIIYVTWNHEGPIADPTLQGFKIYTFIDNVEVPILEQTIVNPNLPYEYEFDIGDITIPIQFKIEMTAYDQYQESIRASSNEITINPPAPNAPYDVIIIPIS